MKEQWVRPPAEVIWERMRRKGWAVIDLADHMEGDSLRNRALLSILFRDRSGGVQLGSIMNYRIAIALDIPPAQLEQLEQDWFIYRRKLSEAGRRLVGEWWRLKRYKITFEELRRMGNQL